jgi:DNA-binding response OmpR family regulator
LSAPIWRYAVTRVLIVEDEPEIMELIGDLLVLEGYEVHALQRIPHGLDAIRKLNPDAIVLDLRLPGMGGIELLRLLSSDRELRVTPVLICSGAEDLTRAHASEFRQLGCEVVTKPFDLDEFLDAVRRTVDRGKVRA